MKQLQTIEYPALYFDAAATLGCGQLFRFEPCGNAFRVFSLDKTCLIETRGEYTYIETDEVDYFERYFDLARDYEAICRRLSQFDELKEAVAAGRGIRILNQDLFETIIGFIVSANNNIPRIKKIIGRLCAGFGRKTASGFYAFPTPAQLAAASLEQLQDIQAGFRDRYIKNTADVLYGGKLLDELPLLDTETAVRRLTQLSGVGPKVADCVALFGMHRTDSYPVDTWIFKTCRTDTLNTPALVRKFYLNRYGADAGYAQQYLFYHAKLKAGDGPRQRAEK